jgi:hypothetical protein
MSVVEYMIISLAARIVDGYHFHSSFVKRKVAEKVIFTVTTIL